MNTYIITVVGSKNRIKQENNYVSLPIKAIDIKDAQLKARIQRKVLKSTGKVYGRMRTIVSAF